MTATSPEVHDQPTAAAPEPCSIQDGTRCPYHGIHWRNCPDPATFEIISTCPVDSFTETKLVCDRHEQLLRESPDLLVCDRMHPAQVVAVLPIGGPS